MRALVRELERATGPRKRGWYVGGSAVAACSFATVTYAAWPDDPCAYGELRIGEIWSDAKADEVERAIVGLDLPYGGAAWRSAERRLDDYAAAWSSAHREACEATHVRQEQSEALLDARMLCLDGARVELEETVAVISEMRPELLLRLSSLLGELPSLEVCSDAERLTGPSGTPPALLREEVDRIRATLVRARAALAEGDTSRATVLLEGVQEAAEKSDFRPLGVSYKLGKARLLETLDRFEDSAAVLEVALQDALELGRTDLAARAATELMRVVSSKLRKPEEALRLGPVGRGLSSGDPRAMARFYDELGMVHNGAGDTRAALATSEVALEAYQRAFGPDAYATQRALFHRATILRAAGRARQAEETHRKVLAIRVAELGASHPDVAHAHNNLANVLANRGATEEAQEHFEQSIEVFSEVYGPTHTTVLKGRANLATLLAIQNRFDAAHEELQWVVEQKIRVFGAEHQSVAMSLGTLGIVQLALGRFEASLRTQSRALEIRRKVLGEEHPDLVLSETNLGEVYLTMNRADEAVEHYKEALRIRSLATGDGSWLVSDCRVNLAVALFDAGRFEEASAVLEEVGRGVGDEPAPGRLQLRASLLKLLLEARSRSDEASERGATMAELSELGKRVQASPDFAPRAKTRWAQRIGIDAEGSTAR